MESIDPEFVERYQILFQKDPNSRVFALLCEAYRKMGMLEKAQQVGEEGLRKHPQFSSGHVALGRVYFDQGQLEKSVEHFKIATEISPENILAHQLLAQSFLKLRQPKEALKAYKLVLLINPNDINAQRAIKKLESLTADEFAPEVFQDLKPQRKPQTKLSPAQSSRTLERLLSLADAYAARNDIDKALQTLKECEETLGPSPEVATRLRTLQEFSATPALEVEIPKAEALKPLNRRDISIDSKKELLERLLSKVRTRRLNLSK